MTAGFVIGSAIIGALSGALKQAGIKLGSSSLTTQGNAYGHLSTAIGGSGTYIDDLSGEAAMKASAGMIGATAAGFGWAATTTALTPLFAFTGPAAPFIAGAVAAGGLGYFGGIAGEGVFDLGNGALKLADQTLDEIFSPLVVDLDNDGIELVSLVDSHAFFDMNSDGFAELTGWVQADDALLAIDSNGNGIIDNITELFGDENTDGFIQLATLDSNGDGFINNQDADFSNLLLWNDLNGNGYSEEDELQNITGENIEFIDLDYASVTKVKEGHSISSQSTVTMQDDSQREIVDVWFQYDPKFSYGILDDSFTYNADVFELPQITGHGEISNLWISMSNDNTLLQMVSALISQDFSNFSFSSFRDDVENIILRWLDLEGIDPNSRGGHVNAKHLVALEKLLGEDFLSEQSGSNPNGIVGETITRVWGDLIDEYSAKILVQIPKLYIDKAFIDAVNALLADPNVDTLTEQEANAIIFPTFQSAENDMFNHPLSWVLDTDYSYVKDKVTGDFTALIADVVANEPGSGQDVYWNDLLPFINAVAGDMAISDAEYDTALLGTYPDTTTSDPTHTLRYDNTVIGTSGDDVMNGARETDDYVHLKEGNDDAFTYYGADTIIYHLGDGHDTIGAYDDPLDDKIVFGAGITAGNISYSVVPEGLLVTMPDGGTILIRDQLGGTGARIETLEFSDGSSISWKDIKAVLNDVGTSGDDDIDGFQDDDTLEGGLGNDTIQAFKGSDTIVYNLGDGNDTVDFYGDGHDDTLVLNGGITPDNVTFGRSGGTLILGMPDGGSITIEQMFDPNGERIELFEFSNGVTMTWNEVWDRTLQDSQTDGDDNILGYRDTNDTLEGGLGNDTIQAFKGSDTIVYNLGDGHDVIDFYGDSQDDTLKFGEGISLTDLSFTPAGNSLDITLPDGGTIAIDGQFIDPASGEPIEFFEFSDVFYTWAEVEDYINTGVEPTGTPINNGNPGQALVGSDDPALPDSLVGGAGDDTIWGNAGDDELFGIQGADALYGGEGNDALNGGDGNDIVAGDNGNDIVWGDGGDDNVTGGDGLDTVYGGSGDDTVDGGAGADFVTGDTGADYVLGNLGDDQIYGHTGDDLLFGQDGNDTLKGEDDNDYVDGGAGADGVYGDAGNDVLYGQDDNDWLDGGAGSDFLNGGTGTDGLTGGAGADIFLFVNANESVLWSGDWIYDFVSGTDKLDVSAIATGISVIGNAAFSGTAGEWRYYEAWGNTVNHLDINGDTIADFEIVMAGQVSITTSDLLYN